MKARRFLAWVVTAVMLLTSFALPAPMSAVREAEASSLEYSYNPDLAISKATELLAQATSSGWSGAKYVSAVLRAGGLTNVNKSNAGDLVDCLNTPSHFGGAIGRVVVDPTGDQLRKGDVLIVVCYKDGNASDYTNGHSKGAGKYFGLQSCVVSEVVSSTQVRYYQAGPAAYNGTLSLATYAKGYTCGKCGSNASVKLIAFCFNDAVKEYPVTVSFSANGGSISSSSKTVLNGSSYGSLPVPTRSGYVFDGWYTAANGGSCVTSSSTVNGADHTLYAHWNAKPSITTQPVSITVTEGSKATFKVVASGATAYQWQYQKPGESAWNNVSNNGTSATYSLTTAARHNGYTYRCKVTNSSGSVYSNAAVLTVTSPPVITAQPADALVPPGGTVTFKVVAKGSALSYQWEYKAPGGSWTQSTSASGKTDTFSATVQAKHNDYTYRCKVSNTYGSVYSNAATLTVGTVPKPVITKQPTDATVAPGGTVTFKVVASGSGLSYQWEYKAPSGSWTSSTSASGKTATFSATVQEKHDGYTYRCKVSNETGSVYTNVVTLSVKPIPVISTQPSSVTKYEGAKATFKVVASGATGYQWQYKKTGESTWNNVKTNGTSATYSLTTESRHNGYTYRCKVSNAYGTVTSSTAKLTVKPVTMPTISTQPSSATVYEGKTATFKVVASGGALKYQWQYRKSGESTWNNVKTNGTSATYSLTTESRHNGYAYRCKVYNAAGTVYSSTAKLTVKPKPVITTQPASITVKAGNTATFKVVATGATGYQWQYKIPGESTWNNVKKNGTSATYSLTAEARHNGYVYRCKVSNAAGSVYSSKAALTVTVTTPVIQKATVSKNTITLTWTAVTGADSYKVYMLKGTSGTPTTVKKSGITGTSCTITGLDKKTTYRFAVSAVCGSSESAKSAVVSATTENKDGIATGRALLISESTFWWDQTRDGRGIYTIYRNRGDVRLISNMLSTVKTSTGHSWSVTTADNQDNDQIQSLISSTFASADDDDVSLFLIATHGDDSSTDEWAGALCTYYDELRLSELANWLKQVPGSVIVLVESCGSGAAVNARGKNANDTFFDASSVIRAFQSADTEIVLDQVLEYQYGEAGEVTNFSKRSDIKNTGEFKVANKFYVLTASDYLQSSYGMAEDYSTETGSYNVFPYYIKMGVGTSGSMPADSNSDKSLTLNELYTYVYNKSISWQTTRVYPTNSSFVLFTR